MKKRNKRGQLVIFLLLAIVLLIAVSLLFYISDIGNKTEVEKAAQLQANTLPIEAYIENCLKLVSLNGLHLISNQGGYYMVPEPSLKFPSIALPYYIYNSKTKFPSINRIESEISLFIEDKGSSCINSSFVYSNFGYNISSEEISAEVIFADKSTNIRISWPIKILIGSQVQELNDFTFDIGFDFMEKYRAIYDLMEKQNKSIDSVPISFLTELAYNNNFGFNLIEIGKNTVIYNLIFNDTAIGNKKFTYNFVAGYNWTSEALSPVVDIDQIPEQNAHVGYEYSYQVKAKGNNLTFQDYSDLFDIDPKSGLIEFVPELSDAGVYDIIVEAKDASRNSDLEVFRLDVIADNHNPIIEPLGDINITINQTLNTIIKAYDPDNNTIFYSVESSLPTLIIHPLTGRLYLNPKETEKGVYTIAIIATDLELGVDRKSFTLRIKNE